MTGRQATAWFRVEWEPFTSLVSPDLLPQPSPDVEVRVRFYQLEGGGHSFREVAIGVPIRYGDLDGEASLLLWTDSERYQIWGRETLGWPIVRGEIDLSGSVWDADLVPGAQGTMSLRVPEGTIDLELDGGVERSDAAQWMARRPWLSPRRVLRHAGIAGEDREMFLVKPTMQAAGTRFIGSGTLQLAVRVPSVASALGLTTIVGLPVEVIDGFAFDVGDQVELLGSVYVPSVRQTSGR